VCALKVLNPTRESEGPADPEFHRRFFLEASTAAKLTHPNTVTIFDYGRAEGEDLYYIAMEYIEGWTLYRVLREEEHLSEARAGNIARQICRSLREAHRMGVVHRDLKPANVMLSSQDDEHDNVKVLDFGLVKDVSGGAEELTQAGLFMGSPKYMSPEQITGGAVTAATDVYSLGVLLFEMLTGKAPFDRGKSVMTLMAHVNEAVPLLAEILPGITVSQATEAIVYRCLEKDPALRYQTMDEVLLALKKADDGRAWPSDSSEGRAAPGMGGRSSMPSFTPTPSKSTPPFAIAPLVAPRFSDAAVTTSAADTGVMTRQPPRAPSRLTLPFAIAVAMVCALGTFVILSARRAAAPATGVVPTSVPTAALSSPPVALAASTPAPPEVVSAAPAPVTEHVVRIDSDPEGATVSEEGAKLCSPTPCNVMFRDGDKHKIQLDKAGFKAADPVLASSDTKVVIKLEAVRTTNATPQPRPASIPPTPAPAKSSGKLDDFKPSPY
jgi:hypothetical protein